MRDHPTKHLFAHDILAGSHIRHGINEIFRLARPVEVLAREAVRV